MTAGKLGAVSHADAFPSLEGLAIRSTQEQTDERLPWVHIVIFNLKRYLLRTYHGAARPHRLQEYIDEFVYRFNRRFRKPQIPNRLLRLCVEHLPIAHRGT